MSYQFRKAEHKKMKRLYVIVVEDRQSAAYKVSQEAYFNYEEAVQFIKSRSDKPEEVRPFLFESAENKYIINDVFAQKRGN